MRVATVLLFTLLCAGCDDDDTLAYHSPASDSNPDDTAWPYEALTKEERAVVDLSRDTAGWQEAHAGFATAVIEHARRSQR